MTVTTTNVEKTAINTIRTLSMDAVQQANSGHPGTPMALAPLAYALWTRFLNYDPSSPAWPDRDRFVLSCGHASMLLYSLLHLAGVRKVNEDGRVADELAISLDDIKAFRQLGSPCAGHPEYGDAAGIETTTGPLGQGLGNSVGMAIASRWLAARYNRPDLQLFTNRVFALCSDGDIMEGVACEAASLAGHLGLANLCWIYDDNHITIEGDTGLAFSEDVPARFDSLGWRTVVVEDANDLEAIGNALAEFDETAERPTLMVVRSVIAWGSPNKANTHGAHGSPLGENEVRLTKEAYGWPAEESFLVPEEVKGRFTETLGDRGRKLRTQWEDDWASYQRAYPGEAEQLKDIFARRLPTGWDREIPTFDDDLKAATRVTSGQVLNAIGDNLPWFVGGSADLGPSTKTMLTAESAGRFSAASPAGRNFHFGIREHAMAATANGMALTGLRPFVSTFFVFSDYLRPSMRLSALMHQPVTYIFTHDSIGLGEDGPTHQPVEQLAACRAIPGLCVLRPGDANEVAECYRAGMALGEQPIAMVLSRQDVPTLSQEEFAAATGARRGAYVLADSTPEPDLILIGTGSELQICVQAFRELQAEGRSVRLVSMPSWELFEMQDAAYRAAVLPPSVTARIAVEAGIEQGWFRYLGPGGRFVGMSSFGASAPYEQLYEHFGITPQRVVEIARELVQR
jgi:transketolase